MFWHKLILFSSYNEKGCFGINEYNNSYNEHRCFGINVKTRTLKMNADILALMNNYKLL